VIYTPRLAFVNFHQRHQRWGLLVCHRRAGKTIAAINDLVGRALNTMKVYASAHPPQYAYIAPFYAMAKRIAFDYLVRYTDQPGMRVSVNIAELTVVLHNGAKIMLFGADKPDALRGIYLDGAVIDEPAIMRPRVFTEVLRPLLADRIGWCIFIGTPNGKNEFWRLREEARMNPDKWFLMTLPASASGLLPQEELDDARRIMSDDEYAQEFECSFEAALKGSFYGKLLNEIAHRITNVEYDAALPVHVSLDLGYTDSTALWWWQALGDEVRYIRCEEHSGLELSDYVGIMRSYGYTYGDVWLPHDARAKSLQTGRSTIEILKSLGVKGKIVPELSVQQGIQASRFVLSSDETFLDAENCADGIEALRQYQREWDDKKQAFKEQPKHDHTSHYADSFRYSALVAHKGAREFVNRVAPPRPTGRLGQQGYDPRLPFGGNVRLNDMWEQTVRPVNSRI
jgi:hypothetical protein